MHRLREAETREQVVEYEKRLEDAQRERRRELRNAGKIKWNGVVEWPGLEEVREGDEVRKPQEVRREPERRSTTNENRRGRRN